MKMMKMKAAAAMKMGKKMSMKKMKMAKKSMKKMSMMRKKAMKKSVIAKGKRAKVSVFLGSKMKTASGLKKSDLKKNKNGRIVSVKAAAAGKKAYKNISKWTQAVSKARKALGLKGFVPVGGKTAKGKQFLAKARSFYKK
jgi:hypothetical protein